MAFLILSPEIMAAAATDIDRIGSWLAAADRTAASSTTRVAAAAGDEVSAAIASLSSGHARQYQALSMQAAAFHAQLAQALSEGAGAYTAAEAANASPTTVAVTTSATENGQSVPLSEVPAIMGVGSNAGGPAPGPLGALPGTLSQGVLLDEPAGQLEFGANPLPSYAHVSGAPVTDVYVTVTPQGGGFAGSGTTQAFIDSGGAYGAVPQDRMPIGQEFTDSYVPSGDTVSVYTSARGTLLYSETESQRSRDDVL